MEKPWYIEEYEEKDYLHDRKLQHREYLDKLPNHEHCELCWNRFSEYEEDLQSGYYEIESKSWICKNCYDNFKELFRWKL